MTLPAAPVDRTGLQSVPSLLSFGRNRLSRDNPLHILDLACGMDAFALGALKAGFSIASDAFIGFVLRASVPLLCEEFPGRASPAASRASPSAFLKIFSSLFALCLIGYPPSRRLI